MAISLILVMCAMFGMAQIMMARHSRRYSRMLDRDDFLFQRREVAMGVRRSASVMVGLGLLFSAVPLFLAFHNQADAATPVSTGHGVEQHPMRLAESLSCVPSNPSDEVCSSAN